MKAVRCKVTVSILNLEEMVGEYECLIVLSGNTIGPQYAWHTITNRAEPKECNLVTRLGNN